MQTCVIVDSHAVIHRAYHAVPPLTTADGQPVHAVYGYLSMLLTILDLEKPEYLALTFDRKEKTFRHEKDFGYKAHREAAPDDLVSQFALVHEVADAFGAVSFSCAGYEADDMVATLTRKLPEDMRIIIVSGDRDLFQLVSPRVVVHDLAGGYRKHAVWDEAAVTAKYGFAPRYVPDFKGLSGDSSDNMPGVPGIGPKTASDLIARFGELEGIYANITSLKGPTQEKLLRHKDEALHYRDMARLHYDAPCPFELSKCSTSGLSFSGVADMCTKLEFKTLLPRLEALHKKLMKTAAVSMQQALF